MRNIHIPGLRALIDTFLYTCIHLLLARAPAIRKMVIGGRKVAEISFIPSHRGTHWKLENQCLVEIIGCILLHMAFYEGGSESSVIGVITLLIDMIGCCIIH